MSWIKEGAASDGKADTGKVRMSLLMTQFGDVLEEVAKVLTFGAAKYPHPPLDDSWRNVPNWEPRYQDALYRHLNEAFVKKIVIDHESNCRVLAHAMANLLFLYAKMEEERLTTPKLPN